MKLDLLAIGAHPDDIELTCSGTVLKHLALGEKVGIADLTQGELGTRGNRVLRLEEADAAATILGVSVRENLRIPDGNIAVSRENILKVITLIRTFRPEILLFPYWKDRHPDHEHAHALVKEALFYAGLEKIETLVEGISQEPFRPLRHYHFMQWEEFEPSFIVDVTKEWPRRMESVRAFRSQFHDPESGDSETILSSPDFLDFIETRGKYFGDQIGAGYGEPFFAPQMIRVENLRAIQ